MLVGNDAKKVANLTFTSTIWLRRDISFLHRKKIAEQIVEKEFTQDSSREYIQKSYEKISKTELYERKVCIFNLKIDFSIVSLFRKL